MRKRKRQEKTTTNNKRLKIILTNKLTIVNHLCEIIYHEKYQNSLLFITQLDMFEKSIKDGIDFKYLLELLIMKYKNKEIENIDELKKKILEKIRKMIKSEVDSFLENSLKFEEENSDPISKELMKDPVTLRATGHVFDRLQIMQCLEYRKKCPITNIDLEEKDDIVDYFIGNFVVKGLIETYKVNFVKKGAELLEAIRKIRSNDQDLIKKGLTIIDMFKNFDLKKEMITEFKLYDCEEEIIVSHEVLLERTNCRLSEKVDVRLSLAKFYIKREEFSKAEKVIEERILKEDVNSRQKEDGLFYMIESLDKSGKYGLFSLTPRTKLKKYVCDYIQCCATNKHYEKGEKMLKKYEYDFFLDESVETLLVKASVEQDNKSKSELYLQVAHHYHQKKEYVNAKKFCKLSILSNEKNIEAHVKMSYILIFLGKKEERIQNCLDIFEMYTSKVMKLQYIQEAYDIDNTNETVLKKYLKYCILIEDKIKFKELLSKTDVATKLLFDEIIEMKQNIKESNDENEKIKQLSTYKTTVIPISEITIRAIYHDIRKNKNFGYEIIFNKIHFRFCIQWRNNDGNDFGAHDNVDLCLFNDEFSRKKILTKFFIRIRGKEQKEEEVNFHCILTYGYGRGYPLVSNPSSYINQYQYYNPSLMGVEDVFKNFVIYPDGKRYLECVVGIESAIFV